MKDEPTKTRYKFINFEALTDDEWGCYNNKSSDCLGTVQHYPRWRKWVFSPFEGCVFSDDCLRDIADFIGRLKR